jgi:hypothetical protein
MHLRSLNKDEKIVSGLYVGRPATGQDPKLLIWYSIYEREKITSLVGKYLSSFVILTVEM